MTNTPKEPSKDVGVELDEILILFDQVSNWTADFYREETPDWTSVMNPALGTKPIKIAKEEAKAQLQDLITRHALKRDFNEKPPPNKIIKGEEDG